MSSIPRVSVITPSYNQAEFLEQTILSVLNQHYPDLEYIVVDGNSNDGSVDIIRKYEDRITWWVSEPDHGQAEAINKGFSRATGEIVAWLNSDDLYLQGAMQSAVDYLMANPSCGLVYGDVLSLGEHDLPINLQRFSQYDLPDLMKFRIIGQPAVFLRGSVLQETGFLDNHFKYLLDHHLWLRIAEKSRIAYSGKLWAAARYHAAAKNLAQARFFGEEAFRLADWMKETPEFEQIYRKHEQEILGGAEWLNAYYQSVSGAPRLVLQSYWKSFRYDPGRVLKDWKRILFTLGSLFGLEKPGRAFQTGKEREIAQAYQHYLDYIKPSSGAI